MEKKNWNYLTMIWIIKLTQSVHFHLLNSARASKIPPTKVVHLHGEFDFEPARRHFSFGLDRNQLQVSSNAIHLLKPLPVQSISRPLTHITMMQEIRMNYFSRCFCVDNTVHCFITSTSSTKTSCFPQNTAWNIAERTQGYTFFFEIDTWKKIVTDANLRPATSPTSFSRVCTKTCSRDSIRNLLGYLFILKYLCLQCLHRFLQIFFLRKEEIAQ